MNNSANNLIELLKSKNQSLALAESCTGGALASTITQVSGVSDTFKGSVVCYASEAKINILNVSAADIDQYTAVSEQVSLQMAQGAKKIFNTDWAISTTGYAGPNGGNGECCVGTVFITVIGHNFIKTTKYVFPDLSREEFINKVCEQCLQDLMTYMVIPRPQ
jgi:PncC family amidohydrolase